MARFRLKPVVVHAEPYRSGAEDEFRDNTVPVLVTAAGRFELAPGDWIVTKDNGEREVVKAQIFQALYEPCSTDAPFDAPGRASRGIPMRSG